VGVVVFGLGVNIGNGRIDTSFLHNKNQPVATGLPEQLNYSEVNNLYNVLKNNYDGQLSAEKLQEGLKEGLVGAAGDPYTEFFTAKEAQEFSDQLNNSFEGIGAELGKDADDNLVVVAPIKGFPAEKAGLRSKDIITSINKNSTTGMSVSEAVNKIRGKKDTKVTLGIVRNKTESLELTITRADIKVPSVKGEILDGNIGYMQISTFNGDTTELARQAAQNFKDAKVKGVILDLRDNPGGYLNAAVDVSSIWLPKGKTILQEKRGGQVVDSFYASGDTILRGVPTVVLINGGSASASEITAGALLDNKVATLIGEKSYGKGSVQQVQELKSGGELKVTVARWFRPNGQNIDKKGITPQKVVKYTEADFKADRDPQRQAALDFLKK
jgi:carboxyl-terminal processing protease